MTATFTMTVESANAAFEDEPDEEMARILRIVAEKIDDGYMAGPLLDRNGNTVGHFSYDDGGAA